MTGHITESYFFGYSGFRCFLLVLQTKGKASAAGQIRYLMQAGLIINVSPAAGNHLCDAKKHILMYAGANSGDGFINILNAFIYEV